MIDDKHVPEDPPGYRIGKNGARWTVVRIADDADLGEYESKPEAVAAAEADAA